MSVSSPGSRAVYLVTVLAVAAGGFTFELQTIIKLGIFAVPNADELAVHEPRPRGWQKKIEEVTSELLMRA